MSGLIIQETDLIYSRGKAEKTVSILVPLFNYERHIVETLNSVAWQSTDDIALIVVDDCSTDASLDTVLKWMNQYGGDVSTFLLRNRINSKLSVTRNTGIAFAQSDYCFMLDADNILYPRCIEKHVEALSGRPDVDAAYSLLEVFECDTNLIGAGVFSAESLRRGNFIDAMAMFRRAVLMAMGGYRNIPHGWEDYDLWLRLLESKRLALHIPNVLARYRQHENSMLRTQTNVEKNFAETWAVISKRHPWLEHP